ncbi:MAG: hypothetical protein ACTSRA_11945 [Promethearchaeota archaeon]
MKIRKSKVVITLSLVIITAIIVFLIPASIPVNINDCNGNQTRAGNARLPTLNVDYTMFKSATIVIKNYTAGSNVNGTLVYVNTTRENRLEKTVNITANVSGLLAPDGLPGWTSIGACKLNITGPDSTNETLTPLTSHDNVYNFYWNLTTDKVVGFYEVTVLVSNATNYNWSSASAIDSEDDKLKIEIYNLLPRGLVECNTTELYRNETIAFNISVFDYETPFLNLIWDLTLEKDGSILAEWKTGDELNQTYHFAGIDNSTLGNYTFKLRINDTDFNETSGHSYFNDNLTMIIVKNHEPIINDIYYDDKDSLVRNRESMYFEVNASDYEDNKTLKSVSVIFQDQVTGANYTSDLLQDSTTGNWTGYANFSMNVQLHSYSILVKVVDMNDGVTIWPNESSLIDSVSAVNNLPMANDIIINGISLTIENPPHFDKKETLSIYLNVSDEEDNVIYAKINLFHRNSGKNYTFTTTPSENYTMNISATIFESGTYDVYVDVIDADFGSYSQNKNYGPIGSFEIDPEGVDYVSTITIIALSAVFGIILGAAVGFKMALKKVSDIKEDLLISGEKKAGRSKEKPAKDKKRKKKPKNTEDFKPKPPEPEDETTSDSKKPVPKRGKALKKSKKSRKRKSRI